MLQCTYRMTRFTQPPGQPPANNLDMAIAEILEADSPYAYSTLTTIQRYLIQFHLQARWEAAEILSEAYLRGQDLISRGTSIYNPHAWLKRTAYNIVREKVRHSQRQIPTCREMLEAVPSPDRDHLGKLDLEAEIDALWQALDQLAQDDPDTMQLLVWRFLEERSWQDIQASLQATGTTVSDVALRQRASRAKKRLRQFFHAHQ